MTAMVLPRRLPSFAPEVEFRTARTSSFGVESWRASALRPLSTPYGSPYVSDGTQTMQLGSPMPSTRAMRNDGAQSMQLGSTMPSTRAMRNDGAQSMQLGSPIPSTRAMRPAMDTIPPNVGQTTASGTQSAALSSHRLPLRRTRVNTCPCPADDYSPKMPDTVLAEEPIGLADSPSHEGDCDGSQTWAVGDTFSLRRNRHTTIAVSVVGPGGGTGFNAPVYRALGQRANIKMDILGQSRAAYDRYPLPWADGTAGPNLETFASHLLAQGIVEKSTCLVLGSRGGQVVLPALWQARGADVPPAVVINGGCAMKLPVPVQWPDRAVTFLLLGGQDYFKVSLAEARNRVPRANSTTAILFVNEMSHMPATDMLMAILHRMIAVVVSWKTSARTVRPELDAILQALVALGLSGQLQYTAGAEHWETLSFDRKGVLRT